MLSEYVQPKERCNGKEKIKDRQQERACWHLVPVSFVFLNTVLNGAHEGAEPLLISVQSSGKFVLGKATEMILYLASQNIGAH